MIIRIEASNIYSFKDKIEFNLLPNKGQHLNHHKITTPEGITFLKLGAIYGANAAGKSNLIKTVDLLVRMIEHGTVPPWANDIKFKLGEGNQSEPSSIAIEFYQDDKTYYYSISFSQKGVFYESLSQSLKEKDRLVFERNYENDKKQIKFFEGYTDDPKNKFFVEVLSEKLLKRNALLLSFLNDNYPKDFPDIKAAYQWFSSTLIVIKAEENSMPVAQYLDQSPTLSRFINQLIGKMDTGISGLEVKKTEIKAGDELLAKYEEFQRIRFPEAKGTTVIENTVNGDIVTIVKEKDKYIAKRVTANHKNDKGEDVSFPLGLESDGTKRMIEYFPMIHDIINHQHVYLIDEFERSIHPMMVKEIIGKLSSDTETKGQLIFTTHESCLLDQNILRPDEIWLVQKDKEGGSKFYSLSDFKIHHTADIENGYLNGRYGGIPFLSDLDDLHWNDTKKEDGK